MRKSELNLMVLQNFILHITHSSEGDVDANTPLTLTANELYKMAVDYIEEDHVDGKEGDFDATKLELIAEGIFMAEDKDETNPVSVFCEGNDTELNPIRIYTFDVLNNVRMFSLTKPQSVIQKEHRDEILDYCLGKVTAKDDVSLADIFMHRKYVKEIW